MSVKIKKYKSNLFCIESKQKVIAPQNEIWDFFCDPKNLNRLTPSDMNFKILSGRSDDFYQGKIISYSVNPFKYFNIKWVTEISVIENGKYFIDEQRFGPYKMWHHEHHFLKNKDNTTSIIDKVIYKMPFGIFGRIAHQLFIRKRLKDIFQFRHEAINKLFPEN